MAIMNGTAAPAYNYADLAAYDVNDDGIYDIAYFMSYRIGKCTDEGTTHNPNGTYLFSAYNRAAKNNLFIDREGKTVTPVAGTFYLYSQLGGVDNSFMTQPTGTMILAKTYSVADSGLVTGIDLNKNTITLNGYDYTDGVWNKGTTYNVGLSNTLGAKVDDMVYNGSLPMTSALLGIRVQLVIDDVSQRVIAILPVTDPDGSVAIFLRDTGRHITDEKSTIVAVYDLNADIQYINAFDIGDGIEEGDLVKLFERDGKYRIEAYRPNEILALNDNFEVNAFNFVDYNNLYIMLKDAKVLVYNGTTFVEYEGKEFGEGTTATGFAYMVGTAGANNAYNASFIYIMGDADVETVSTVSRATSSIVYIANVATNYAYQNYDALGGHVYGMAKITVYNAIDAITGEIKTVTFEGEYGDRAESGFYYIDKNNILRQDVYGNLVSANAEMTVYGGETPVCPYEVVYGGNSRYGLDYEPYYVEANGTYVNVKTALAGEVTHGPVNCYNGNAAMYTGNAYGSDVIVVFYGPFFG